jgi:hypothetical protein
MSDCVGKVEKRARKSCITRDMDERRKWKNVSNEDGRTNYRRLMN